ncbi:50S ribosomal protein L25/general stress protein Ctc [Alcaligenes sp. RM2]|uniref:Large ribosomal subunit protein bL25 n=1 Tax=Alcaligenes phenolicus TaxID=232846 RepID=A0AAW5VJT6_9BURK|nr:MULTISPECIES: 50S ribosomal protein L25/general stress protein Ctc [Alcaligenes]EKU29041.1 50S ribosomal protein L25/general stress protein Ctc [Alcaligenes sp. HPC1271]ERT56040.1 50S ribosomal protein L25 [Alcaligenes sp. EGD-AK7]MCR4145783.1 50S ribosomal protein L25/general stress protein Ctc [Alcaligenes faecalis]MCX5564085.1 50S ribosomal protein L25/general stress protein Ctc [Alcaligenes phenolicus]QCP81786.1 50S ribosomal protein L25/general stress protein Ctc [Alcaligenes faecalis]
MKFTATSRDVQGTGASRRLRRAGQVPAIVYGGDEQPVVIALDHNETYHNLRKEAFHASILTMELDGKAEKVLLRSVQWHPYKQQVLHVDFQRVLASQAITTKVPLNFEGGDVSPAVKLSSQVISHILTELEITCLPANLPASITVDLSGMTANANVHLDSIKLPRGVTYAGNEANPLLAAALPVGGGAAASEATEESAE